jgi:hypothetical protein
MMFDTINVPTALVSIVNKAPGAMISPPVHLSVDWNSRLALPSAIQAAACSNHTQGILIEENRCDEQARWANRDGVNAAQRRAAVQRDVGNENRWGKHDQCIRWDYCIVASGDRLTTPRASIPIRACVDTHHERPKHPLKKETTVAYRQKQHPMRHRMWRAGRARHGTEAAPEEAKHLEKASDGA